MTHVLVGLGGAKSDHSPSFSQTGTEDIGPTGRERGGGRERQIPHNLSGCCVGPHVRTHQEVLRREAANTQLPEFNWETYTAPSRSAGLFSAAWLSEVASAA